jgi:release factor glutamine methyltransferase
MRLRDLAAAAERRFVAAGIPAAEARLDAELLLRDALGGWDRAAWLSRRDDAVPDGIEARISHLVRRREAREPIAYIRGVQAFYGRDFAVGPGVLIPRPETELLVDVGLAAVVGLPAPAVLDIGTGSGCLAITFALECPGATVVATDISADALAIAAGNARRFAIGAAVTFVHAAGTAAAPGPFDLVVSNPPYVPEGDRTGLQPEVRLHEPGTALFAGADGLEVLRVIASEVRRVLRPGGTFAVEIGRGQAAEATAIVRRAGFDDVRAIDDLQAIARVVVAR